MPPKINSYRHFLFSFFACILLASCAKYKVQHLSHKEEIVYSFEERKNAMDLSVRTFDQESFKNYLPTYQPLLLHIKNKTATPQILAINDISLPIESFEKLKTKEPKIFFINYLPCIFTSLLGFLFWWEIVLPSMFVLGACGTQLSIKQHERAIRLLKQHTSFQGDTLTIKPYTSHSTLIFVKRTDYTPRFTIAIKAPTTIFNVFITARTVNAYHVT